MHYSRVELMVSSYMIDENDKPTDVKWIARLLERDEPEEKLSLPVGAKPSLLLSCGGLCMRYGTFLALCVLGIVRVSVHAFTL